MMEKRGTGNPLTCDDCRKLLRSFVLEELDTDLKTEVRRHLITCDECEEEFVDILEDALLSGEIPMVDIPETAPRFPAEELFYAFRASEIRRTPWNAVKDKATEIASEIVRKLEGAISLWGTELVHPGASLGVSGQRGARAVVQSVSVRILDRMWQPTEEYRSFKITEPPVITGDGRFSLSLSTGDTELEGRQLICKMELVEGGEVTFETTVRRKPGEEKCLAKIEADGLPALGRDVHVPLERLRLYIAPGGSS